DALNDSQLATLDALRRDRSVLYRCWQLKEGLRDLFRLRHPEQAGVHLDWWLAWACRCRIPAFVTLSKTIRTNRHRILAAVELGLSNSKLEGLNSKIRLINHRGYGHHSAAALIAMIYLCCGGITVELPTERSGEPILVADLRRRADFGRQNRPLRGPPRPRPLPEEASCARR